MPLASFEAFQASCTAAEFWSRLALKPSGLLGGVVSGGAAEGVLLLPCRLEGVDGLLVLVVLEPPELAEPPPDPPVDVPPPPEPPVFEPPPFAGGGGGGGGQPLVVTFNGLGLPVVLPALL